MANNNAKDILTAVFVGTIMGIAAMIEEPEKTDEEIERKAKADETFNKLAESKVMNRGTVIAAASKAGWTSYDIQRLITFITNPETAEAAVGLIEAGYNSYDIRNIIKTML